MFSKIAEKKQQIDKLISVSNAIKDLKIHSSNEFCELYIDSQFNVSDFKLSESVSYHYENSTDDLEKSIIECINKAIHSMQHEIQTRSNEIFS